MTTQAKVYIVTSGCYSGYGIESTWTTREKAEAALALVDDRDKQVEEFWLDVPNSEDEPLWLVTIEEERTALSGANVATSVVKSCTKEVREGRVLDDEFHPPFSGHPARGYYHVEATNEAHAIKIATERHYAWLATQGVTRP
jgi:hypothetical protein